MPAKYIQPRIDGFVWITGIYEPVAKHDEWASFAYGPFPDEASANLVADDPKAVLDFLGRDVAKGEYEIVEVAPMSYSQACKHFEETIQSPHFEELLPETHAAHLELMNRKAV